MNANLAADTSTRTNSLFTRSEAELDADRAAAESAGGEELADLNLYYTVKVAPGRQQALIDALNAEAIVEVAYAAPNPEPAAADIAPPTSDYLANQGYLRGGPNGIDARFAWTVSGGTGSAVKIVDIEGAWNTTHEDLNLPFATVGSQINDLSWKNHGTAVLGEMVGVNNAYGVKGGCYGATYGISGINGISAAAAINAAAAQIASGDILLIELHAQGPDSGDGAGNANCPCNCGQYEYVAMEYWQAEYDAIKAATNAGKIVVEAAGNGSMNLDSAVYGGVFNPATRDSGAILVGAGVSTSRQPACFTNYGARVNVQGWGDSVFTLGYGNIQVNGADQNQWYATGFSGTSSASPIVVAAAADVQGNRKASGLAVMTSAQMRTLLTNTGTAQPTPVTKKIGPLPNLRAAIAIKQPPALGNAVAARQSNNITAVFAAGADGALYRRWVSGGGAWQGPSAITGTGLLPVNANLAFGKPASNQLNVFYVGNNGALYSVSEVNDGAFGAPVALTAANFAPPGAPIATGMQNGTQLDVLVVRNTGALSAVYTLSNGPWTGPVDLIANFAPAGAGLAAGVYNTNQLDVFAVGSNGAIRAAWVVGMGLWNGPLELSAASLAPPGAPVATGNQGTSQIDVFVVGNDGGVKAMAGTFFWTGPFSLTGASFAPVGSRIAASPQGANTLDVFVVANTGAVNLLSVVGFGAWSAATPITGTDVALPGSAVTAATIGATDLGLFNIAHMGLTRSASSGGAWSAPVKLPQ